MSTPPSRGRPRQPARTSPIPPRRWCIHVDHDKQARAYFDWCVPSAKIACLMAAGSHASTPTTPHIPAQQGHPDPPCDCAMACSVPRPHTANLFFIVVVVVLRIRSRHRPQQRDPDNRPHRHYLRLSTVAASLLPARPPGRPPCRTPAPAHSISALFFWRVCCCRRRRAIDGHTNIRAINRRKWGHRRGRRAIQGPDQR